MRDIVRKVANPKNELVRYLYYYMNKEINNFQNVHVKEYLKSCLRQSIEYYKVFETANIEISPLLGFYSLLNLGKLVRVVRTTNYEIQLGTVETMFKSHGASSTTIDDVKINTNGTFVEFANSTSIRTLPTLLSILDLYKLLPDINSIYEELYPGQSKLIKAKSIDKFMNDIQIIDSNVDYDGIAIDSVHSTILQSKYAGELEFINYNLGITFVYINSHSTKQLNDFLMVDSDKRFYLSNDTTINLQEEEIIYLIFFKYSSLVRYKPKNWTEKLNSDEYSIITKIIDESLTKFWSIIARYYINDKCYIL